MKQMDVLEKTLRQERIPLKGSIDIANYVKKWKMNSSFLDHARKISALIDFQGNTIFVKISGSDVTGQLKNRLADHVCNRILKNLKKCGLHKIHVSTEVSASSPTVENSPIQGKSFFLTRSQQAYFKKVVKEALVKTNGSTARLAQFCGLAEGTVSRWSIGIVALRIAGPKSSLEGLKKLAKFMGYNDWKALFGPQSSSSPEKMEPAEKPSDPIPMKDHVPEAEPMKIDAHKLLLSVITAGADPTYIHKVECENKHLSGYAVVPEKTEPTIMAVQCSECGLTAGIGRPIKEKVEKTSPPEPKIEEKKLGPIKQDDKKKPADTMKLARQIKADKSLELIDKQNKSISIDWDNYSKMKPARPAKDLEKLIKDNPYQHKIPMEAPTIFRAVWLAMEVFPDNPIRGLGTVWGCTEAALRQRIEKTWDWLTDDIRMKIPFMAKFTIKTRYWANKIAEKLPPAPPTPSPEIQVRPEKKEEAAPVESPPSEPAKNAIVLSMPPPEPPKPKQPPPPDWRSLSHLSSQKK